MSRFLYGRDEQVKIRTVVSCQNTLGQKQLFVIMEVCGSFFFFFTAV